jgi:hypothetical protein
MGMKKFALLAFLLLALPAMHAWQVQLNDPADGENITVSFSPISHDFIFSYVADPGDPATTDCTLYFDGLQQGSQPLSGAPPTSGVITVGGIGFGTHSWKVVCNEFGFGGPFNSPTFTYVVLQRNNTFYCDTRQVNAIWMLGGAGFVMLALLAALAFMIGEAIHEPRFTEWAKTEPYQIGLSAGILIVAVLFVQMLCSLDMGSLAKWTGQPLPNGASIDAGDSPFGSAVKYLEWGADNTLISVTAIRAQMGSYNQRATVSVYDTGGGIGAVGTSSSPYAGDYSISGVLGSLLNMNTVFLLSIYFQYYSLLLFSSGNGVFMMLLPIGFVLRCVPGMRGVGGAVASLAIALYFFYPLMLAIFGLTLPPIFQNYDAGSTIGSLGNVQSFELNLEGSWSNALWRNPPSIGSTPLFFQVTVFNFLRAVFFPTAGILLIAMLARDLSKLFGEEIDATKLVQMV